jgi:hypothetical protein
LLCNRRCESPLITAHIAPTQKAKRAARAVLSIEIGRGKASAAGAHAYPERTSTNMRSTEDNKGGHADARAMDVAMAAITCEHAMHCAYQHYRKAVSIMQCGLS